MLAEPLKPIVHPAGDDANTFDRRELRRQLSSIADRMMRGHIWLQGADKAMRCTKRPLTGTDIANHVDKENPFGLCPIRPGESTTLIALLDMDSHKGEVPWPEMVAHASRIIVAGAKRGIRFIPFRSTGGSGIHLLVVFAEPQDAYSVRQLLGDILSDVGFTSGTKGVAKREVEVFPKQDAVAEGKFGSMFVLPYSRKSCALEPEHLDAVPIAHLEISGNVLVREKPPREPRTIELDTPELRRVMSAVRSLPSEPAYDHDKFFAVACAIHDATDGSDDGRELLLEYAERNTHDKRTPEKDVDETWPYLTQREGGVTVASLFKFARDAGWRDTDGDLDGMPDEQDAPDIPSDPPTQEQAAGENTSELPTPDLPSADMAGLFLYPPVAREWLIPDWLARGVVTGLFSRGGLGKTLLAQQLATCIVLGRAWLNMPVKQGKVLGIMCEEDENDLRWRQKMIMDNYDPMNEVDLDNRQFMLVPRLGGENVLMHFDNERKVKRTRFFKSIEAMIAKHRPDLVILDNAAQLFAGLENDRSQVTIFVNALARLAREYNCAVLLLGHTAKAEGSEFSGSTAWENVMRVRWRLKRDRDDDSVSNLAVEKSNLGSRPSMPIAYQSGHFVAGEKGEISDNATGLIRHVLVAVQQHADLGGHPNHARYLPRALTALEGAAGGYTLAQLTKGLKDAVAAGYLQDEVVGVHRGGSDKKRLGLTTAGNQWLSDNVLKGKDSDDLAQICTDCTDSVGAG